MNICLMLTIKVENGNIQCSNENYIDYFVEKRIWYEAIKCFGMEKNYEI